MMDSRLAISQATPMLSIVLAWETFKDWLSATAHLSHWALHVILGLAFFFVFGRLLRRPIRSFLPLLPVAVLELGNEVLDFLRAYIPHWDWNAHDTIIEVALTLGPSLALIVMARSLPVMRRRASRLWFRIRFPPRRDWIHIRLRETKRLKHLPADSEDRSSR